MINKIFVLTLCLIISSCAGFTSGTGLKFKTGDDSFAELKDGTVISFEKPIGNCGSSVTFFGILIPIIPVWFSSNNCDKIFDIAFTTIIDNPKLGLEVNIKLKYNGVEYDPVMVEKVSEDYYYTLKGKQKLRYGRKFKFKIENVSKFKNADDKVITVIFQKKDGKEFTEELPVKWEVMIYNKWAFPGV